jgi:hypothetical protein
MTSGAAVVAAQADEHRVELIGFGGQQGVGLVLDQPQLDPRVLPVERTGQAGEAPVRERLDEPDREPPAEQAADGGHRIARVAGAGEHGLGVRQERLAGRGQPGTAAVPDEQRLGQLRFQAVDLLADRGLRDRDPLSRTGEVAFLGDRQEVRQLPQFHTQSL